MPKYSVRMYAQYCDEYLVEAADADEACDLADAYGYLKNFPPSDPEGQTRWQRLSTCVIPVTEHEYVDTDTCVNEVDEDGNWLNV